MFIFKREQSIYEVTLTAFKDHNIWSYHASMFKNKNEILQNSAKKNNKVTKQHKPSKDKIVK